MKAVNYRIWISNIIYITQEKLNLGEVSPSLKDGLKNNKPKCICSFKKTKSFI